MRVTRVKENGIDAELPKQIADTISDMDKRTFCLAYMKKDDFHKEIVGTQDISKRKKLWMKRNIDNYFEIEKRRRDIIDIDGNI
jgi:hypothetical protein